MNIDFDNLKEDINSEGHKALVKRLQQQRQQANQAGVNQAALVVEQHAQSLETNPTGLCFEFEQVGDGYLVTRRYI